ncbi:MAG: enoyl-CoA hydratase/isomerase family protein [Acetobacteraceae bacterium]|nr:enoyl-CoA hydratase/isomerase family protein [Acetobacteraceae bacterium]MDW8398509.1 enoyl-CoA hydratase/isomerase family protein [Acetobacteraceae bacterium]
MSVLLAERRGDVLLATLNRPHRRNAMDAELQAALDSLFASCAADPSLRVLVLAGAGGHFCAGLDLSAVAEEGDPAAREARALARNRATAGRFAALASLPQVTVACVEGVALAGALGLVAACDIVLAEAGARFGAPEVKRGLVPAQILPWLVRRMGFPAAKRLAVTGATLTAEEALRAGLVDEVLAGAEALAARRESLLADLREAGPRAVAETKALSALLAPAVPEGYTEAATAAFARTAAGAEAAEGVAAFREKRPPAWAATPR